MLCAFRFYGALNDFLPRLRRGRRFTYELRHAASVKDVIEALGIPHPEIELIVVNGTAEDFSYRLRDGDRVAAYPPFRTIGVGDLRRVGATPPQPVRFALDEHLGKLAALLRLAGFDTLITGDDARLARVAAADDRVLLTRDVALLKRSEIRWGHWVRNVVPVRQLGEVLDRFDLFGSVRPFSRCLRCNVPVVDADAEAVASRILPRTRAEFREFRECPACRRVYWKGSHYQDLCRLLDSLGARSVTTSA